MAEPISYYFTLFKKFQVIDHVPDGTAHGAPGGLGGFNLNDPNSVFGSSNLGSLLGATTNPADSPLWAILNSRAQGNAAFAPVTVGGQSWPTMPADPLTQAWNDLQVSPPTKLVDTFGNWISAGKVKDIPNSALGTVPPAPIPTLDAGVGLFVCSMPGDVGIRPGGVPPNYWATSLIFLVDPATGNTVFPATLTAGSEYYLVAVIGNRGNSDAGIYLSTPGPGVESSGVVMVWNTVDSPGVELPSLSNLDVNDRNPIYEQYLLRSGTYDVVGFRLNVQTVYDGIIAALNDALKTNPNLTGGLTPDQWVHAQPAHLCAKVLIRQQGSNFPNFGDSPVSNPRLAQKNLAPFDINVQDVSPVPNIVWKNFIPGQPFFFRLPGAGRNRLILEVPRVPEDAFKFYIGIPTETFHRVFSGGRGGAVKGFTIVPPEELCRSKLGNKAKPFPDAVVLQYQAMDNALEFPALPDKQYFGMSLGIEYNVKKIKPGTIGEINLVHRAELPKLVPGTRCFEIEEVTAGGFTIVLRAHEPRQKRR